MFKKITKFLLLIAGLSTQFQVSAGDFTGTISDISSGKNLGTNLIIAVDGQVNNKETCNSNSYWDFSVNTSDVGANTTASLILMAFASGKEVIIAGSGSCANWHNIEDILNFRVRQ